jgi:hypothetical protein
MFLEQKQLMGHQFVLHNSALWHDLERKCVYCFFLGDASVVCSYVRNMEKWSLSQRDPKRAVEAMVVT